VTGGQADDVVAETFLVAWRRLDDVPTDDPLPWLLGVARNVARNERRSTRRRDALVLRLPAPRPAPPPDEPAETGLVRAALAALDEADRELLLLVAWDGLTPGRAAQVLGCSAGAARVRLHRARRRFADELGKRSTPDGQIPHESQTGEELDHGRT